MANGEKESRHILSWDGRITAGSLLSAIMLVGMITVWGVRIEGRLETETAVRSDLSASVQQQLAILSATIDRLNLALRAEADMRERMNQQINARLDTISGEIGAVSEELGVKYGGSRP